MRGFKVSFILTKSEFQLVMNCFQNVSPTLPARYILEEYLTNNIATEDEAEGLVFKKLARKEAGKLIIEPVLELFAKSILSANKLWVVKCLHEAEPVLIIRAQGLFLFITNYTHETGAWKVTPFLNAAELIRENQDGFTAIQITAVCENGKKYIIKPEDSFKWLEEEHYV